MRSDKLRIFLSSTFRDLMPEREQLIKKIFPKVRALCRERGVEFTEIDLRWGITEIEAHTRNTVRICLEEIDRCRPYFLGIIGSRYGWIPELSVLAQNATLFQEYPWLEQFAKDKKSITDIEFFHGAISKPDTTSAFIYEQTVTRKPEDAAPIDDLRSRIIDAGVPYEQFSSPEELGEKVLRDLTAILDRDWPAKHELTPVERERNPHEAYARNRTHSYIANPEYYSIFEKFVDGLSSMVYRQDKNFLRPSTTDNRQSTPLILWGKSGFGKSALVAHLTNEYKQKHPEAFIIRHFVGATAGASSSDDVIRHVMLEIKERYDLTDELPQSNLQEEFPIWLAKIREGEKLILAIDAVNQLTGIGNEMHWLPEFIPANVRLLISTTPELPLEQLRKRNWQEIEVKPLAPSQRKRITQEFLAHYHKHLEHEQLEVIANEPKLQSPLYLRTLLEELRIFGSRSRLDQQLADYISSSDEAELFQKVLARMETDHGEAVVRSIMSAIWASRFGLSETELLGVTGLTRLALSEFLIALEFHLMQRTGLFTFFHNYLRQAIEFRYLATDDEKKAAHKKLAEYFSKQDYTERRSNEEPYQWIESGEREKLLEMFGDSHLFLLLATPERHYELLGYWTKAEANDELATIYSKMFDCAKSDHRPEEQVKLFTVLGGFLTAASKLDLAQQVLEEAVSVAQKVYGDDHRETANTLRELATVYLHQSNFTEAEKAYNKTIDSFEKLGDLKELSESLSNLAAVNYRLGKYDEALNSQRKALEIATKVYGRIHPIVSEHLNNLATILNWLNSTEEARILWEEAIDIGSRTRGKTHPQTITHRMNLAKVFTARNQYYESLEIYTDALRILNDSLGNKHSLLSYAYKERSEVQLFLRAFKEAESDCSKSIDIYSIIYGVDHLLSIGSYLRMARIKKEEGENNESIKLYKRCLPLVIEKLGVSHQESINTAKHYYEVLQKADWREEIEDLLYLFPTLQSS